MYKNTLIHLMGVLMAFILNYSVAYGILPAANPNPIPVLIYTVIFIFLIKLILKYYIPFMAFFGYIMLFTAYPFLYGNGSHKLLNFFDWSYNYLTGKTAIDYSYVNGLCILMYFIVSLVIYLFAIRWKLLPVFLILGMLLLTVQWYGFVDKAYIFMLIYVVFCLIYLVILKHPKDIIDSSVIGWGGIMAFIILTISLLLPNNIKPVKVQKINDFISEKFDLVHYARGSESSSETGYLGFSDGKQELGGRVIYSNKTALYIKTSLDTVYLRGRIYDTYDGKSWTSSGENEMDYTNYDQFEPYKGNVGGDQISISLRPGALQTSVIFNVLSPISISTPDGRYKASDDFTCDYNKKLTDGDVYNITAFVPKINLNIMRKLPSNLSYDGPTFSKYLTLPNELPKRVIDLAKTITSGTACDIDKALKLQNYLRNLNYSLNMNTTPYNKDFVDNFLFEQKKGYCTYFASAMAVMLRAVGIPSRYVVGFIYQNDPEGKTYYDGYKRVTDDMSHAWVEAYFPDYGWVTFEPTPFYLPTYMDPSTNLSYEISNSRANVNIPVVAPSSGSTDAGNANQTSPNSPATNTGKAQTAINTEIKQKHDMQMNMYYNVFRYVTLIVFIILLLYEFIKYIYIRSMDTRKKSIYQFKKILKKLKKINYPIEKGETLTEYGRRLSKNLLYDIYFNDVIAAYNRIYYGKEASNEDAELISEYLKSITRINILKW